MISSNVTDPSRKTAARKSVHFSTVSGMYVNSGMCQMSVSAYKNRHTVQSNCGAIQATLFYPGWADRILHISTMYDQDGLQDYFITEYGLIDVDLLIVPCISTQIPDP